MLLPSNAYVETKAAIGDPDKVDMVLRRILNSRLLKKAEEDLAQCYRDIRTSIKASVKIELGSLRSNLEYQIEFLNRESIWMDEQINSWLETAPLVVRKTYELLIKNHG